MTDRAKARHYIAAQMAARNSDHGDGRKTACTSTVLEYFGIDKGSYHYSQFLDDVVAILRRRGYSVRSRRSSIPKRSTVGSIRNRLNKIDAGIYIVQVPGHVMIMDSEGRTVVDTAPRKRDRRQVTHLYLIGKSKGM